jgi:energy-converting hydrogenase Eha subunit E
VCLSALEVPLGSSAHFLLSVGRLDLEFTFLGVCWDFLDVNSSLTKPYFIAVSTFTEESLKSKYYRFG